MVRVLQVTAFPRKRAAAERHGVMLDGIMSDLTRTFGVDVASNTELVTLKCFLQYCCSFEHLAVIQSDEMMQGFEVSLSEFLSAFVDFSIFCEQYGLT